MCDYCHCINVYFDVNDFTEFFKSLLCQENQTTVIVLFPVIGAGCHISFISKNL